MKYTIDWRNIDGTGAVRVRVYHMPVIDQDDFWSSVTNVACPVCDGGVIRWAENGYVPGYRICNGCGRHFLATGKADEPRLVRLKDRRYGFLWDDWHRFAV